MAILNLIARGDRSLMQRANNWNAPHWVRAGALVATRLGNGWAWYFCGACILIFGGRNRLAALAAAGLAAGASVLLFQNLKRLAGRRRPCQIEPHRWATLLPPDQFSFPSGHTMTAFAVALSFSLFYPPLAPGLFFCAFCIAASRILLGMHFFSDVLAGALIGCSLAYGACAIFAG